MFVKQFLLGLAFTTALLQGALGQDADDQGDATITGGRGGWGWHGDRALYLNRKNVQDASKSPGNPDPEAGQSPSLTDKANFINFCSRKKTTNGIQRLDGSCNGVVMGDIPSKQNMISTIILYPGPGANLKPNTPFDIKIQVNNLVAGSFSNPVGTYYSAPQQLKGGKVIGHSHIVIQSLGASLEAQTPPDPSVFVFFKGVNDKGDGKGGLRTTVGDGLAPGFYRVCTMTAAMNHQPVMMPVAQRGAQDDCQKFTVGKSSDNKDDGNDGDKEGEGGKGGRGDRGGRRDRRSFITRTFIA
ncbi:hypothetical protein FQN57_001730 [Myotisia sp. PD_48]|nr:hypothetical protein FQN57_001730 [Myotisia sp. PD_48]